MKNNFEHPKFKEYRIGQVVLFCRSTGEECKGEIIAVISEGVYEVKFDEEGEEKGNK